MGSAQGIFEFNPDSSKRSERTTLDHHNKLVIFGENTENQVAYLLSPLSPSNQEGYSAKLKVKFNLSDTQNNPIIGVAVKELDPRNLKIESNGNLYVWYIAKSLVKYRGVVQDLEQPLPIVESEAEVILNFVVSTGKLSVEVINPGKDSLHEEITLTGLPSSGQLLPFVGAVSTGHSSIEFQALESSTTIHNNNSMIDVTHKAMFTTSYGVVDVSRDCKSVTRTSTQQGNGCALLPIKLSSGVHRWGFEVHCDFGASLCLGIARYPFMLSDEYIKDHLKHVYRHPGLLVYRSYRGLLYRDGKQMSEPLGALGWQHNGFVAIEFLYDSSRGTLEVIKNNKSLGVAFDNLTGSFQPVVCFYAAYEKEVRLKHYLTTETSLNMVQSPPSSLEANVSVVAGREDFDAVNVAFDESQLHGVINISSDKKAVFREKSDSGNSFCFLNVTCIKLGSYRISFIIEYDQGASTCLGVTQASKAADVKMSDIGNIYTFSDLYLYRSFQGMVYMRGKELTTRLEEYWMSGTLVEMEIKIAATGGSVSFKVNAMDQGVVFTDLKPPLTPLVAFYAGMEKRVTVLHYEYFPFQDAVPKHTDIQTPKFQTPKFPSLENDTGLNDIDTTVTHAPGFLLPILCSSSDAAIYYPSCMKCDAANDVIALPCKHSTVCSKDLTLGVNAPTRHCMICDEKIMHVWNILQNTMS